MLLTAGSILLGILGGVATAADIAVDEAGLPAVSGPNGKLEFGGGWVDLDGLGNDEIFSGGAALSFPVGDMFGIQADLAAVDAYSDTTVTATLHAFTRDPNAYLLGAIGGYADAGSTHAWFIGPEAELYLDNVSIELRGGYMDVNGSATLNSEAFAFGDIAYYATDDVRLSIGASSVAGFQSANAGLEWFLGEQGLPGSLTLNGQVGEDGFTAITAGFAVYFGSEDKSLIRRHREDDPKIFKLGIFEGAASVITPGGANEECPDGEFWNGEFCEPIVPRQLSTSTTN